MEHVQKDTLNLFSELIYSLFMYLFTYKVVLLASFLNPVRAPLLLQYLLYILKRNSDTLPGHIILLPCTQFP